MFQWLQISLGFDELINRNNSAKNSVSHPLISDEMEDFGHSFQVHSIFEDNAVKLELELCPMLKC